MLQRLKIAKADGTYTKLLDKIKKQRVLILDDFAMIKIDSEGIQDLFEIVEDRYAQGSTLITAQLSKANWHEALGGGILADGVCDRLYHNCHFFELSGDSYRQKLPN